MSIYTQNKRLDGSSTIGAIILYAGNKIPAGWLVCDGTLLQSRNSDGTLTPYDALYRVLGTKYGEGSEVGSFRLPDLVERFAEGSQNATTLGTKIESGLPDHNHTFTGSESDSSGIPTGTGYNTSGNHTHTRGDWRIYGEMTAANFGSGGSGDGCFSGTKSTGSNGANWNCSYSRIKIVCNAADGWTGETSDNVDPTTTTTVLGNHYHSVTAKGTISTLSGSVYGGSIVQPNAIVMHYIIKYK